MLQKENFVQTKLSVFLNFCLPVLHFEALSKKSQNFSGRTYGAFLKNGFYLYRGTVSGNKCLKKKANYKLNRLQAEGVRRFLKKIFGGVELFQTVRKELFCNSSEIINQLVQLPPFERKTSKLLRNHVPLGYPPVRRNNTKVEQIETSK